jgi:hypothetical protein
MTDASKLLARPQTADDYVQLSDGTWAKRSDLESKGLVELSSGEWVPQERARKVN